MWSNSELGFNDLRARPAWIFQSETELPIAASSLRSVNERRNWGENWTTRLPYSLSCWQGLMSLARISSVEDSPAVH